MPFPCKGAVVSLIVFLGSNILFLAMSTRLCRSRRLASAATAAPSPGTPPPARLLDLPTDLLLRALSRCGPADIARVAAVSLLFHSSLAAEGIRLWAQERGFELPAQPEGESCAVRWLCYSALLPLGAGRRARRERDVWRFAQPGPHR